MQFDLIKIFYFNATVNHIWLFMINSTDIRINEDDVIFYFLMFDFYRVYINTEYLDLDITKGN